ncbi:MAG: IclR family transcriptional regulator C-terminal domain-containing protein [Kaiparowitsia implicata GSE-PSE-MK54-09C]|nr:IclR family transcriptional regulator C-terminal domain-containing protein [Kaiparowitsia implicata GSE-PSE-MK54-09C]
MKRVFLHLNRSLVAITKDFFGQMSAQLHRSWGKGRSLASVRADGFAVDDEEHHPGLRCVASPVFKHLGDVLGAISVSGLAIRLTPARIATIGALTSRAGKRFSSLFWSPADVCGEPFPAAFRPRLSDERTVRHLVE